MIINDSLDTKDNKDRNIEEKWKTIRGTHVDVDDEGNITKGPDALKNKFNKSNLSKKDQQEYESKPSSSNYSDNKRLNTKLLKYRDSMSTEDDKESFDYLMSAADDNLKNFIGQWASKADNDLAKQNGEILNKVSHKDNSDQFFFLIPGNQYTALSKSRYNNFGNENNYKLTPNGTGTHRFVSKDGSGDIELSIYPYYKEQGGTLIKINKEF